MYLLFVINNLWMPPKTIFDVKKFWVSAHLRTHSCSSYGDHSKASADAAHRRMKDGVMQNDGRQM